MFTYGDMYAYLPPTIGHPPAASHMFNNYNGTSATCRGRFLLKILQRQEQKLMIPNGKILYV